MLLLNYGTGKVCPEWHPAFLQAVTSGGKILVYCLIYIVPTGNLENMLSDGIVTFDKTKKKLEDFSKVISVPVWLIGIDVK